MKNLFIVLTAVLTTSVFAISESSTWSEIQAELKSNHDLKASGLTVFVGRPVDAFSVCNDGENFVTLRKFPIYKNVKVPRSQDNDGDKDGYTNVKVGEEILTFPVSYTSYKEVCRAHDKNCKRVAYTVDQETTKEITISKFVRRAGSSRNGSDREVYKTLFTKSFEIPACE